MLKRPKFWILSALAIFIAFLWFSEKFAGAVNFNYQLLLGDRIVQGGIGSATQPIVKDPYGVMPNPGKL